LGALGVTGALAWLFFRSWKGMGLTAAAGIAFYIERTARYEKRQEDRLRSQCKDALLGVSAALSAGYALENAIGQARPGLVQLWGEESQLVKAWDRMEHGVELHIPVEQLFEELAGQLQLPEMTQLAGLLHVAKRSGGRMSSLFQTTATQLEEHLRVEADIQNRLTEKRMELSVMLLMPPGVLLYLQVCSYDMIASLYETLWGQCFMGGCLLVYGFGWWMGMRILNIRM
jgi:tight adherence protein B